MKHLVFNRERMEFRYGSGMTVYSEYIDHGRLLCADYHFSGMPEHPADRLTDVAIPAFELEIDGCDMRGDWEFTDWAEETCADGRPCAVITLHNRVSPVEVKIYTLCGACGFFTRFLRVRNLSEESVSLTRIAPLSGCLWTLTDDVRDGLKDYDAPPFAVGCFKDMHWGTEGNFAWRDVPYNATLEFGSETGRSGHTHPFAVAHSRVLGGYFVCQMAWSANWRFRFQNDFRHIGENGGIPEKEYLRMRFSLAPQAVAPMRVIEPGEAIESPRVHMGYIRGNFDDAINGLHDYQRKYLLARPAQGYQPVCYNHWGYMRHELSEKLVLNEVERAAELGAEMFVVDAGWFGRVGSDWFKTVGDWHSGPRLERDLFPIVERAHALGMGFGLWVEPEAVGPESELNEKHPDWLMMRYGDVVERSLDLSKPEVEKYLESELIRLIERYGLDMIRLDYNNQYVLEGGFSQRGRYSENNLWRNVEAIYRIFDHIGEKYPSVLLENCASGGGRTDMGMMSRFSQTQYSDWYMFPRVARTFNGMTMCLPPECLLGWYGEGMNVQRYGGNEAQMQMMVMGVPYISGLAPSGESVNPALIRRLKEYIQMYKSFIRPIQRSVLVYHHTPVVAGLSGRGWVAQEFMTPDGAEGYATVFRLPNAEGDAFTLKPRGIDPSREYEVKFVSGGKKARVRGYELAMTGLTVSLDGPLSSEMFLFHALEP